MKPEINRAAVVRGKTLTFRDVSETDAQFILDVRTDPRIAKFLSPTVSAIESQISWLRNYSTSNGQAYFIVEFEGAPIGTVRLYDARGNSFSWGSWTLIESRPRHAAVESALMVYSYGLDHLRFEEAHFEVMPGNEKVCAFHERFGAVCVDRKEGSLFYNISKQRILDARSRLVDFLPNSVTVMN